jgi:hypothetical protein
MNKGKFWPPVRRLIWQKAEQMFQEEQMRTMGEDWKAITPERRELREKGLFHEAKLIMLREIHQAEKEGKQNGTF